jgi:hypothetical protein
MIIYSASELHKQQLVNKIGSLDPVDRARLVNAIVLPNLGGKLYIKESLHDLFDEMRTLGVNEISEVFDKFVASASSNNPIDN